MYAQPVLPMTLCLLMIMFGGRTVFESPANDVFVAVLGNAQDAGFPQSNCQKDCCRTAWKDFSSRRFATSIAIIDTQSKTKIMLECTPNYPDQMHLLKLLLDDQAGNYSTAGIFLTHAHIGHYAGLVHLGREVEGTQATPVYVMPRMREFLIGNGPWSQLVELKNIVLHRLTPNAETKVGRISLTPIRVPHRDEFSETVGFRIQGPHKRLLFLPDIDKWERWKTQIEEEIKKVDFALLDGTFFDGKELPGRDLSKIPHPFVTESMRRFDKLAASEKEKIHFIHLNHTNRLLQRNSQESIELKSRGYRIARQGQKITL
ncbi:MAG: MBL fold metallo-hydrolase [Planctomycetota bacterium]|jgi:pyrroloquinoline quinone biosynthesis protein B|nr:MBL fold metallo-hydrolase [Planctomycetota bacterium]